jgi:hypothetical protein
VSTSYTTKIDRLLALAADLDFTEEDFLGLALAAADQAGATLAEQMRVADALGVPMRHARGKTS